MEKSEVMIEALFPRDDEQEKGISDRVNLAEEIV
jgi:hypothetical protein